NDISYLKMDRKERQLYLATVPSSAFESGNLKRYYGCLTCYPFISDKLHHPSFDVQDVINDYDYIYQSDLRNHSDYDAERTEALKLIQETFRLSAHILRRHPEQLISQLLGRLSYPFLLKNLYIQSFLEQAKAKITSPALIPYFWSLHPPSTSLIRTLLVSLYEVNSIAITSDGAKIISAASGTVKVWDIATGQESLTLTNPNSLVDRVAVSQDGTKIVGSFYHDGIVKVWDVKTGRELLALNVDSYCVNGVALTPDGTKIVTGGWDQNVKVWDIQNGKKLLTLTGHKYWEVEFVAVTADGTKIISAHSDSTIKVWDIQTGRKIRTLIDCWRVNGIAVTSDGAKIVAACGDETIKVWHIDIKIWNVLAESLFSKFNARNNEVSGVIKTPDQAKIAPILGNKTGKLWDITKKVWDMVIGRPSLTLTGGHKWSPSAVTLTPDAAKIVSGGLDETIRIWDLRTGEQLGCLRGHNQLVNDLAVTPDGTKIVSASNDGTVKIWHTETGYEIRNSMRYVGVTPDGTRFVFADWDGMIKIWDMETNRELYAFTAPIDRVNMRDSTPDRTKIISVSSDEIGDTKPYITNNIVIWNIETGHALLTITGHNSVFNDVAVTPDGEKIVSASRDGMVKVWDIETGQVSLTLAGHNDAVTSVKVTPDGKKIVSSGWDRTVKVWDIETGECLTTFVGESRFGQVIISFDGKKIFAKEFNLNRDGALHFLELIV
ncbi:MAG: WD40 repeat domain-containing protein, partial [Dolichospermum sp.]